MVQVVQLSPAREGLWADREASVSWGSWKGLSLCGCYSFVTASSGGITLQISVSATFLKNSWSLLCLTITTSCNWQLTSETASPRNAHSIDYAPHPVPHHVSWRFTKEGYFELKKFPKVTRPLQRTWCHLHLFLWLVGLLLTHLLTHHLPLQAFWHGQKQSCG